MRDFTIRPASITDVETLAGLIRQYYEHDRIAFDPMAIRRGLKVLLADQTVGLAWLVGLGAETVGYSIVTFGFDLEFGGRQATLTDIFIEEGHRNSGLGGRMLRVIEEYCRRSGAGALELQVERQNTVAQAFYKRHGFGPLDRLPMSKTL